MNKKFLLVVVACLAYLLSFAQEVQQEQRSLVTKVTATWCPNCGNWGWTLMEGLMEDNGDKALMIGAHFSGTLESPEAIAWGQNFNIGGQPVFLVNNTNVGANSSNHVAKRTEISDMVTANLAESPVANAGVEISLSPDNELIINTKTRFFQATEGDYYLAVYILEDEVEANQSGNISDNIHPRVLRQSVNGDFGESIASGSIAADMEMDGTYTMAMNENWNIDHLRVTAIIWQKDGDTYNFVNGDDTNTFVPFVHTKDLVASDIDFRLSPTVVHNKAVLSFDLEENQQGLIRLLDINGRLVNRIFEGELVAGTQQFEVVNQGFSGLYLVQIQINGQVLTEKIVFE